MLCCKQENLVVGHFRKFYGPQDLVHYAERVQIKYNKEKMTVQNIVLYWGELRRVLSSFCNAYSIFRLEWVHIKF